ncbi:hypothetical protein COW99_03050 [Candidatus Roizmanbacteria bacterium CG22_combo_CG10-13_8_21_14_all_38_20]|uniref:Transposase IS200-like domain-containing protein n=1 Tax=Candidatus Roizmanbacteria bacterium CG22_combo_CG10-13_8_21_14_all_38_20 TaxID=1974862 RepID=A0A2H0BV95_9BACT|nr:hypothetical protein [Candidatus Microgenomates bacterium]PIP61602.1 MAG: hypothetical protein COW99_03050 [Candidatus Roizmanbacteria bacterium CG22_combo_CG10-13_8_21_14_all_38_20]PJC30576.1 MAG: hypothetical protein CO050_05690 [Candidatus Roizmanbacteria bacterium CG_4_9_14_0_2_um_filter_38_17]
MTFRKTPLITGQYYHVYNRSVANQIIFRNNHEHNLFIDTMEYYMFDNAPHRLSNYLRLTDKSRTKELDSLYDSNRTRISMYAFCLMPNHYHLLVRQNINNGISSFIRHLQNSHAKYLNIKSKRTGSLYQNPFKGTIIETNEQFIHVARYIHINPLTSYLVKKPNELRNYPWCSFSDYINLSKRRFITKERLLSNFSTQSELIDFTLDRAEHQRELSKIKHLI